jgi:orotidine-5'-phosphate decarboxylase
LRELPRETEHSVPRTTRSFNNHLQDCSLKKSGSKIILALDLPYRREGEGLLDDAIRLLDQVSDYVCAIKINFHLIIPLSIQELSRLNDRIHFQGLVSIADIKLNDIANTNNVATSYLWDAGFDAVIVNPFVGFKGGLDVVYETANLQDKGVISLAYMSHPGADEGYGLETRERGSVFELMVERANAWGSDAVILGTTRTDKIKQARASLRDTIKIMSPGSGTQGGDPGASLKAGADYLIYGRAIVSAEDSKKTARQIFETVKTLPA